MNTRKIVVAALLMVTLLCSFASVQAADQVISDARGDVTNINIMNDETEIVTSHPDIDVKNLDLLESTYTQSGKLVTVTMAVAGAIENRGNISDLTGDDNFDSWNINTVSYTISVATDASDYTITYINKVCQLSRDYGDAENLSSSDFSTSGDTLTVHFELGNATETYDSLSVESSFMKINLTDITNLDEDDLEGMYVMLTDVAPNPPLSLFEAEAEKNLAMTGETIQFNSTVEPFTGQPPYTYLWDFGDGTTSTERNPTHVYDAAKTYTYTCTITDADDATDSMTGTIKIQGSSGSVGGIDLGLLVIVVIAIIAIIGVAVVVYLIRR